MSKFILINKLKIQNANAIAGFTWGFPAITHFLGYTHNLTGKLANVSNFTDIKLHGCAVIAHSHHVHTYGKYDKEFTQSRNPPYLASHDKSSAPPVIEEGKMNMTISLLIECSGNIGNREESFIKWLEENCLIQRVAGGSVINEKIIIKIFSDNSVANLGLIKRMLLPGFVLIDQSILLQKHYDRLCETNPDTELLDAWLDFSAIKKTARPYHDLISKYLYSIKSDSELSKLKDTWQEHLEKRYFPDDIPDSLINHFTEMEPDKKNRELLNQWQDYINPNDKTNATWEYVPKQYPGYLVPIMTGYKAISPVYEPSKVKNSRDYITPVCFVEAVHSIGEWMSVHRIKTFDQLKTCFWHYHHEKDWYLCKKGLGVQPNA